MASAHSNEPIDILRKTVIVVLMIGAMLLLHRFAVPDDHFDPRGLLALGFVILATYTIGELTEVIGLPHITGYLLAGVVLGPSMAHFLHEAYPHLHLPPPLDEGILSHEIIEQLSPLNKLALALIALTAGGELKLKELREGLVHIVGLLVGQAIPVTIGVMACVWGITQFMPGSVEAISGLPAPTILALAAVVASLAFATSPAATIAIINSTGSKGPMARTVLSTVVLKDVIVITAFFVALAVSVGLLGVEGAPSLGISLGRIGLSIAVGVGLGFGIHFYLRFIGAELLLFIIAMIYTFTFLISTVHGEAPLMFIVAGIVVGNWSDRGETLIHEVERLSLPVYVVFFTLAGAGLHLDLVIDLAIPALLLVGIRILTLYAGVRVGARATGAPEPVARYGWMGFVSQAGVVIALAGEAKKTLGGEVGLALNSLLLAGVAINEVIGPVLLQWGLGLAGEVGGDQEDKAADPRGGPTPESTQRWVPSERDQANAWGKPVPTGHAALDEAVEELGRDLRALARDQTWLPLSDLRRDTEAWVRQLRREFLRISRRAAVRPGEAKEIGVALRNDIGELGERWRDLVLDLAARTDRPDRWSPLELSQAIDEHVATLPERFESPVHPDVLQPREERWFTSARRSLARARNRVWPLKREVPLRQLARYRFCGEVPGRLEGLAALLVNAELHLASRITALFALIADGLRDAATLAEEEGTEAANERLAVLRHDVDAEFQIALEELEAIAEDGSARAAEILGGALQQLRIDARTIGTLDLHPRRRRYGRVFAQRNEGLTRLGPGLQEARHGVRGRLTQLALELELVGLEGRIRDVVSQLADRLVRNLRGRGPTQVRRAETVLGEWTEATRDLLLQPPGPRELATQLRTSSEPVVHNIAEAHEVIRQMANQLADESWVNELLDHLRGHIQSLTESYEVPTGRPVTGEWALPRTSPTTSLPFRDVVSGFVEVRVTRDLLDLTLELSSRGHALRATLEEVERVVAFNVELASAELDVLDPGAPIPPESTELVHAMVIGAVGRSHAGLDAVAMAAEAEIAEANARIHEAVIGGMSALRNTILDGNLSELRSLWIREAPLGRQLARRARRWKGLLPNAQDRIGRLLRGALGEDRLLALREALGLPEVGDERDLRSAIAPPSPQADVPMVYRRLFSEHALEAGDLLSGRQIQLERLRAALAPSPSGFRSAAVVGLDLQAGLALVTAATRSQQPVRWSPVRPVSVGEVDAWFAQLPAEPRTVVIQGLRWLFVRRPGGTAPLERLVKGIVSDRGRHAFVVVADQAVWSFAVRSSGLEEAMGTVVRLAALDVEQLEQALLSRHAMSGLEVTFEADEDLGWQLQHVLLRGEDRERRRRRAWFRTLHAASAGVLADALRLWMAAIEEVDAANNRLRIGAVPRPPLTRLAGLPEHDLLTLLEVTRQGWIDAQQHADLFCTTTGWSEAHLAQLHHVGLLIRSDEEAGGGQEPAEVGGPERLRLAPHLRGPLHRVLSRRGWA